MKKLLLAITLVIAAASVAVCVAIQKHSANAIQGRADSAAAQAQTIADLDTQNQRLSKMVDKLKTTQGLSHDELIELARLRNNIGQARQLVAAKPAIEAANAKLRDAESIRQQHIAEAQAAPNYWPKNQLAYAGFATPEDAVKSLLWSMSSGNFNNWQSNCTPQAAASMEQEWQKHGLTPDQQQAQLKAMADGLTSPSEGFHIVNEQFPSPDQANVALSFDGEDAVRTFVLKKIDGQWKFDDMVLTSQTSITR